MTVTFFTQFSTMHHRFTKIRKSNRIRPCIIKLINVLPWALKTCYEASRVYHCFIELNVINVTYFLSFLFQQKEDITANITSQKQQRRSLYFNCFQKSSSVVARDDTFSVILAVNSVNTSPVNDFLAVAFVSFVFFLVKV